MFTAIIDLHGNLNGWKLIEPFFYSLQSGRNLKIFFEKEGVQERKRLANDALARDVYNCLIQERKTEWQAILLVDLPAKWDSTVWCLGEQLKHIRQNFINKMEEKGMAPENVYVIAVDSLERNEYDGSPRDDNARLRWQLDTRGFVEEALRGDRNYLFCENDFLPLDQAWGDKLNLTVEGRLLNNPSEEFLEELKARASKVWAAFEAYFETMRNGLMVWKDDPGGKGFVADQSVNSIEKEFFRRLEKKIIPPLDADLDTFKPSELLKGILRDNLALSAFIDGFRVLRYSLPAEPDYERINALVDLAHILILLSTNQDISNSIRKARVHFVEMERDEQAYRLFLENYKLRLTTCKKKIEELIQESNSMEVPVLEERDSSRSQTERVRIRGTAAPHFGYLRSNEQVKEWTEYCKNIDKSLLEMENANSKMTGSFVSDFNNSKRNGGCHIKKESRNMNEYVEFLSEELKRLYSSLTRTVSKRLCSRAEWSNYSKGISEELSYYLKARPSALQVLLLLLSGGFLTVLLPYILTLNSEDNLGRLPFYIMVLIVIAGSLFAAFAALHAVHKRIVCITEKAKTRVDELLNDGNEVLEENRQYISKLSHIHRVRQINFQVQEIDREFKKKNILLRFHRDKIAEHIRLCDILLQRCTFRGSIDSRIKDNRVAISELENYFDRTFDAGKDIIDNGIFYPIFMDDNLNEECIRLGIGVSSFEFRTPYLKFFRSIRLEKDRVYWIWTS